MDRCRWIFFGGHVASNHLSAYFFFDCLVLDDDVLSHVTSSVSSLPQRKAWIDWLIRFDSFLAWWWMDQGMDGWTDQLTRGTYHPEGKKERLVASRLLFAAPHLFVWLSSVDSHSRQGTDFGEFSKTKYDGSQNEIHEHGSNATVLAQSSRHDLTYLLPVYGKHTTIR